MNCSGLRGIFFCLWVVLLLSSTSSAMNKIISVKDFFPEVRSDLTKITWAHAVNSHAKLQEALTGSVMMLEADVIMAKKEGTDDTIPVMAHPPDTNSDLTFNDFLENVIKAVQQNKRKGIKLDFKDSEAVTPVLKALKDKMKQKLIGFPVWVNADVLKGPVNATKRPLDPHEFITRVKKYVPHATLSIGWTTRFGSDDSKDSRNQGKPITVGKYGDRDISDMLRLLSDNGIDEDSTEITFPVRAGIAAQSIDEIMKLIGRAGSKRSLTIWSAVNDPVDMVGLRTLIQQVGDSRCYIDLPFTLETGPEIPSPSPEVNPDQVPDNATIHAQDSNDSNPEVNGSSLTSASLICMISLFMVGVAILLI